MRKTLIFLTFIISVTAPTVFANEKSHSKKSDIPYGEHPRQKLDIYFPRNVKDETPIMIFLHGGGFTGGSKTSATSVGSAYAKSGMIVVIPNYRIDTAFPNFISDAAKAVAFTRQELRTDSGEFRPIVMSGWSAGAYIAGMVSYDQRYLKAEGVPADTITGFIGLAGPYWGGLCAGSRCPNTFPSGTETDWPIAGFVDGEDPPMLLAQGTRDIYVDMGNLETLAAAGEKAGISVTKTIVKGRGHSALRGDMVAPNTVVHSAVAHFIAQLTSI